MIIYVPRPPKIVDYLIQSMNEALVAYGTLESRIGMGSALCESSFYMPMLKVAKHLAWESQIEVPVKTLKASEFGDVPRIDFYGHRAGYGVAIELKFKDKFVLTEPYPKFEVEKFKAIRKLKSKNHAKGFFGFRMIVGRVLKKEIDNLNDYSVKKSKDDRLLVGTHVHFNRSDLNYYSMIVQLLPSCLEPEKKKVSNADAN
jgi:hypothetical protein